MSTTPLTPTQLSTLQSVREQGPRYRLAIVPPRHIPANPSTLAALVRRSYLEKRTIPHVGYRLTQRAWRLFESAATKPEVVPVDRDDPAYRRGVQAANAMLDCAFGAHAQDLIMLAEKAVEEAQRLESTTRYLSARGVLDTLNEFVADQGKG
jgi:hypothetical protein